MRQPTTIQVYNPGPEWYYDTTDGIGQLDKGPIDPIAFVPNTPSDSQLSEAVVCVARAYHLTIQSNQVSVADGIATWTATPPAENQANEDNDPS
jgi:hypothetical protein